MSFNWCYFPLEVDGLAQGIHNPLPDFVIQNADPWAASNGWFTGDGLNTSLITPWETAPLLFEGVALPEDGAYLLGFQVELGAAPLTDETILFCGYNSAGNIDGLRVEYSTNGKIRFTLANRNFADSSRETRDNISNSLQNIFCYIDHRPAGIGVDSVYVHAYEDGTDIKATPAGVALNAMGAIFPQQVNSATALIVGALLQDGAPVSGTYFSSKVRRLHMMRFGALSEDVPSNVAELMGELSRANMIPTAQVLQIAGFGSQALSRTFVQYV